MKTHLSKKNKTSMYNIIITQLYMCMWTNACIQKTWKMIFVLKWRFRMGFIHWISIYENNELTNLENK